MVKMPSTLEILDISKVQRNYLYLLTTRVMRRRYLNAVFMKEALHTKFGLCNIHHALIVSFTVRSLERWRENCWNTIRETKRLTDISRSAVMYIVNGSNFNHPQLKGA
jgi:hypothetical protein